MGRELSQKGRRKLEPRGDGCVPLSLAVAVASGVHMHMHMSTLVNLHPLNTGGSLYVKQTAIKV